MKMELLGRDDVAEKIKRGNRLLLAGDHRLLDGLPSGEWIGGTIPYFMAPAGGVYDQERILVHELPDYVESVVISDYDVESIHSIYRDSPGNGVSMIIVPAQSDVLMEFALKATRFEQFASAPLIGWVSGVSLEDLDKKKALVYDGRTAEAFCDRGVVMHIHLKPECSINVGIVNIFEQGEGDELVFEKSSFAVHDVLVNGEKQALHSYIASQQIDVKQPLVADYYGAAVNASIQQVNEETGEVSFFAPVFEGVKYRFARPVGDYVHEFERCMPPDIQGKMFFSCNCILNYLYSELEGRELAGLTGPFTFGEIAYQLLNQTMVYVTVEM